MDNSIQFTVEMYRNMIKSMASDMKFTAIVSIILGAINCLSIIGAVIGIPVIFAAIRLRESAQNFEIYAESDEPDSLKHAHERLSKTFNIVKILLIIYIAFSALAILSIILMILFMGTQIMNNMGTF